MSGKIYYTGNHTKNYPREQNPASFALEKLKLKLNIVYSIDTILLIFLEISTRNFRYVNRILQILGHINSSKPKPNNKY